MLLGDSAPLTLCVFGACAHATRCCGSTLATPGARNHLACPAYSLRYSGHHHLASPRTPVSVLFLMGEAQD